MTNGPRIDDETETASPLIRSIEDTARWVAYHRATESERPDALFNDPYARHLAGERGARIGRALDRNAQFIALRTRLFDDALLSIIDRERVDFVLNLAAGLDMRPYRLRLPETLRWVEVDLPDIISIKSEAPPNQHPRCALVRLARDLSDATLRRQTLAELAGTGVGLVMSEGLLTYLTEKQVSELAQDIRAQPSLRYWLVEVVSPKIVTQVQAHWGEHLAGAQAPMLFAPRDWQRFYRRCGWRVTEFADLDAFAVAVGRMPSPPPPKRTVRNRLRRALTPLFRARPEAWTESGVAVLTPA